MLALWGEGYGINTIAIRLRISSGRIAKQLRTLGLYRNKEEATEAMKARFLTAKESQGLK